MLLRPLTGFDFFYTVINFCIFFLFFFLIYYSYFFIVENQLVSVERVMEYTTLPSEAPETSSKYVN